jgi:hypothetical protein
VASHHQYGNDNVVPFRDYVERPRFVRPMAPEVMARAMGEPVDLYRSLDEQQRIARVAADVRRDLRIMRLQAFIQWASIGIAVGTILYFIFQAARGL